MKTKHENSFVELAMCRKILPAFSEAVKTPRPHYNSICDWTCLASPHNQWAHKISFDLISCVFVVIIHSKCKLSGGQSTVGRALQPYFRLVIASFVTKLLTQAPSKMNDIDKWMKINTCKLYNHLRESCENTVYIIANAMTHCSFYIFDTPKLSGWQL